jgi:hypothetical protein
MGENMNTWESQRGKGSLGRPRHRRVDNIKTDLGDRIG